MRGLVWFTYGLVVAYRMKVAEVDYYWHGSRFSLDGTHWIPEPYGIAGCWFLFGLLLCWVLRDRVRAQASAAGGRPLRPYLFLLKAAPKKF